MGRSDVSHAYHYYIHETGGRVSGGPKAHVDYCSEGVADRAAGGGVVAARATNQFLHSRSDVQ